MIRNVGIRHHFAKTWRFATTFRLFGMGFCCKYEDLRQIDSGFKNFVVFFGKIQIASKKIVITS